MQGFQKEKKVGKVLLLLGIETQQDRKIQMCQEKGKRKTANR